MKKTMLSLVLAVAAIFLPRFPVSAANIGVTLSGSMQAADIYDPAEANMLVEDEYGYYSAIDLDIQGFGSDSDCVEANPETQYIDMEAGSVYEATLYADTPCDEGVNVNFSVPAGYLLQITPNTYDSAGVPFDNQTALSTYADVTWWEILAEPKRIHFFKDTVRTDTILPDGQDRVQARLSFTSGYPTSWFTGSPVWSIAGDTLGCTINPTTGWIQAGTEAGEINIQAADSGAGGSGNFVTGALRVGSPATSQIGLGWCANATNALTIGLGKLPDDGSYIGSLRLKLTAPAPTLTTPAGLNFGQTSSDNVLPQIRNDGAGVLRQVQTPGCLADVTNLGSTEYEIRLYWPENEGSGAGSFYLPSGQPFKVWRVQQQAVDGGGNVTQFTITEDPSTASGLEASIAGGAAIANTFTWNPSDGAWTLNRNGVVQEEKIVAPPSSGTWTETVQTSTPGDSGLSGVTTKTYTTLSLNGGAVQLQKVLVEDRRSGGNPDGLTANPDLVTHYFYSTTTATPDGHEELELATNSDGSWESYQYNSSGLVTDVYQPWMDATPPAPGSTPSTPYRHIHYDYTPVSPADTGSDQVTPRTITVSVVPAGGGAQNVSESFVVLTNDVVDDPNLNVRVDIQAGSYGAAWNASGNLATVMRTFANGPFAGYIQTIDHPDGTRTLDDYYQSVFAPGATNTVEEVSVGAPGTSGGYSGYTVSDGIATTTTTTAKNVITNTVVVDIRSGIVLANDRWVGAPDYQGRFPTLTHLDGTSENYAYNDLDTAQITGPDGDTTVYNYDNIARPMGSTVYYSAGTGGAGIETENSLDASGNVIETFRTGTDGSVIDVLPFQAFDQAGRLIQTENALGGYTTIVEGATGNGGRQVTTTNPDGGTRVEDYYRDGRLSQVSGSAVQRPMAYAYGADSSGELSTMVTNLTTAGGLSSEWMASYVNFLGQADKTVSASASGSPTSYFSYNSLGQLVRSVDPDGIGTLYAYDNRGRQVITAVDVEQTGTIDFSGSDRITWTTNDVVSDHGENVNRTQTLVWNTSGSATPTLAAVRETSTTGLDSWQTVYQNAGTPVLTQSHTVYGSGGARMETVTAPDNSYIVKSYSYSRPSATTAYDSANNQIGRTACAYDPHGRQASVTDVRTGTTTFAYNSADQLTVNTTPSPGAGGGGQVTTTYYDSSLRATNVVQPDGTGVTNFYYHDGQLQETCGSRTYPVAYTYDYAGRPLTMTTWQNFSAGTGAAVTTWIYDAYQGFLTGKTYADGTGPLYTNSPAGRLVSRTWARQASGQNVTTVYGYDTAGEVNSTAYYNGSTADPATPAVTTTFDRLGRPATVTQGGMVTTETYNLAGQLLAEAYAGGPLDGLATSNTYDGDMRRSALSASAAGSPVLTANYGYDAASRLATVNDGNNNQASYSYLANSPWVNQITFAQSGAIRMTTGKKFDNLDRLMSITSTPGTHGQAQNSSVYTYNTANQRTSDTWFDNSHWDYQYDALGQVTNGVRCWMNNTLVAGQQFQYRFDNIGNRTLTAVGGNASGLGLRQACYGVDSLNQLTNREVPGTNDVVGAGLAFTNVLVNSVAADRMQDYFHGLASAVNTNSAQWLGVSVTGAGQTVTGNLYLPRTPERFQYDPDGNLLQDGRWVYTWDGENRLLSMTVNNGGVGPQYELNFTYDAQGRRIQKIVAVNGVPSATNNFLYDGWNLIAVLGPQDSVQATFTWGTDLSGSWQEAGGVGGLLEASFYNGTTTNAFVAYDGNGNVAELVNAADGTVAAEYEYGPLGEIIRADGPLSVANPFRIATKYQDDESAFLYYGSRYYNPSTGKWINRDPSEEQGGANLYGFVGNDPIDNVDAIGLSWYGDLWSQDKLALGVISDRVYYTFVPRPGAMMPHDAPASVNRAGTGAFDGNFKDENGKTVPAEDVVFQAGIQPLEGVLNAPAEDVKLFEEALAARKLKAGENALRGSGQVASKVVEDKGLLAGGQKFSEGAPVAKAEEAAILRAYSEDGGHHIPAKSAFRGDPAYDVNAALAIPNSELAAQGISHSAVTGAQQTFYRAYAQTGKPLTWEAMQSIETQALVKGGMSPGSASAIVNKAINALKISGISGPTRIPWGEN